MRRIRVSYDVVTPESAEHGDVEESGWDNEEGIEISPDELDIEEYGSEFQAVVKLAAEEIRFGVEASSSPGWTNGTWYTEIDGDTDYSTMAVTRKSYHLDGFTEAEEKAIYCIVS